MKCRASILILNLREFLQKFIDIGIIICVGPRITCREYAGSALQGIDGETRVVRDSRQPCCGSCMSGFDQCVGYERSAGFVSLANIEVGLRHHREIQSQQVCVRSHATCRDCRSP